MGREVCDLFVVKRLRQYVLRYAMTVNYHGICTAQQSMHNSNPGILAIPQLYIKPNHNLYGKSETTSIATQEASHKTFSPQPRRSSHWKAPRHMMLHTNSAGVLVIHLVIHCNSLFGLPNPGKVAAGSLGGVVLAEIGGPELSVVVPPLVFGVRCSESGKLLTTLVLSVVPLVPVSVCCPTLALSGG